MTSLPRLDQLKQGSTSITTHISSLHLSHRYEPLCTVTPACALYHNATYIMSEGCKHSKHSTLHFAAGQHILCTANCIARMLYRTFCGNNTQDSTSALKKLHTHHKYNEAVPNHPCAAEVEVSNSVHGSEDL
eukprot:GHRR01004573.1.p2 GENE.GHRR01004573.1~~GHRR01004573.1.p2  ORF type:complete len:132 (-),score=9.19 GHRR01004573.1:1753-2148(-)